ncbi:sodium-dependent noradrenaline transporter [Patella vulgata]|uniref:sodium-dependent noradrenaline transporter n=1 Tax=Patella vulgata TaxID=6465 RepID=UPI00217FC42B|nr:sodium-dependent noradrenaline transporter [Patella vulgata]
MGFMKKIRQLRDRIKTFRFITWFGSLLPRRAVKTPNKQQSFRKWSASIVFIATELKMVFDLDNLPDDEGFMELKRNPKSSDLVNSAELSSASVKMAEEEGEGDVDLHRVYTVDQEMDIEKNETFGMTGDRVSIIDDTFTKTVESENPKDNNHDETQQILEPKQDRDVWGKKMDFLLSTIGYAVDLSNVWRFPHLCYKNGGGAFLIPYFTVLFLCAGPVFLMEMSLGQYHRLGPISVWKMSPIFKGIGYSSCFMAYIVAFYYNIIIGWAFFYLFSSFTTQLPWTTCGHEWNSDQCWQHDWKDRNQTNNTLSINDTVSSTKEFFERGMLRLDKSEGLEDLGPIRWPLFLCTLFTFIILYFCLWKGVKSSGKVVWVTATLPYIILAILLIQGVMLPGAVEGIEYFIKPNLSRLNNPQVWIDAAVQVMFSVGAGFGTHIAYSSYNKFTNNCYSDCIITMAVNCFTSVFSGIVIFAYLGYMSLTSQKGIDQVATEGPGLVFIVYPEAVGTLPGSVFWSMIFFLMLITLGLDSAFGGLESPLTGLNDELKNKMKHRYSREILTFCVVSSAFIFSLPCLTEGGAYVFNILDNFAAGTSILFAVMSQVIAVSWFYGIEQFSSDLEQMTGRRPGLYWRICWKFISPILLLILVITSIIDYVPLSYTSSDKTYNYPLYANIIGWCIALSIMLLIPAYAVYKLITTPGSLKERISLCISPEWEHQEIKEKKYVKRFQKKHWLSI